MHTLHENKSEAPRGRNIVLCCDGTGNRYSQDNTNVVKVFELLNTQNGQIVYYAPGVGTSSHLLLKWTQKISQVLAQAFGLDLHRNVENAYLFLMNNYKDGDRIYLFGFSRGAHTVRRLASMLEKCGLLHKGSNNMIPYASQMYLEEVDEALKAKFKATFSRSCPIHFLGVWDTVAALSMLAWRPKLDGATSREVKQIFHAIAIDEHRAQFPPNLFVERPNTDQVIEQVWFAGVHSDIGGSYGDADLSNLALKWMVRKAVDADLDVNLETLSELSAKPTGKMNRSWFGIWWFLPHGIYLVGVLLFLGLVQIIGWPIDYPLNSLVNAIFYDWKSISFSLCAVLGLLLLTRREREIPRGSNIHWSVKVRRGATSLHYNPSNLQRAEDVHITDEADG